MIEVKQVQSTQERKSIFDIRREVFVVEQKVSEEEEYDQYETSSTHFIAFSNGHPAGTCRVRNTDKGVKLERFAVLKEYRGKGIGQELVEKALEYSAKSVNIYLHAQIQVVEFYAKFGFVKVGEMFEEAGIKHYKMKLGSD